jgi:hypothetical protein
MNLFNSQRVEMLSKVSLPPSRETLATALRVRLVYHQPQDERCATLSSRPFLGAPRACSR